jgi:Sulfatase
MPKPFKGKITLDIRDSVADWDAFLPDKAPEDAPNVLVVLYDDTGCAAWSPYGGRIQMPTLQRLADNGLTYSQWHTTALCSPTRSVFLTGRNHHQNGFATISEAAAGFPGYSSHIPPECAPMATVLRDAGWSTFWIGKNHNTPIDGWTMGSSKKLWPLGLGYDRFYGFLGGEIYDCCGVELPDAVNGAKQTPLPGVSMRYSFDDADAPTTKETQYYEMLGTRGIWHKGWKAVAEHGPLPSNIGKFDQDRWQLFHADEDRAEAHDLAEQHPDKLEELKALWTEEAKRYDVLPLNDLDTLTYLERFEFRVPVPPGGQYTYYPGTSEVPERSAANVHGVSYKVLAEVEFTADTQGVIFAAGSRFGGHALFVKDGTLTYAYNFLGIPPETRISAPAPSSGKHIVGVEFKKERLGEHHEAHGPLTLYIDEDAVAEDQIRTMTGHFALCGEGLCIGYDGGDAVSSEYEPKFELTGGTIVKVVFDVADDAYVDVERHFAAAMARD